MIVDGFFCFLNIRYNDPLFTEQPVDYGRFADIGFSYDGDFLGYLKLEDGRKTDEIYADMAVVTCIPYPAAIKPDFD